MAIKTVQKKGGLKTVQNDTEKKTKQTNDVCLKTNDRLFTKTDIVAVLIATIPIILIIGIFWYVSWGIAWNVEYGEFVRAEYHPERVINVTWVLLDDGTELMYGTHNPEVLDLVPGESYWFGEGLISGNYGKRLIWVADENPLV